MIPPENMNERPVRWMASALTLSAMQPPRCFTTEFQMSNSRMNGLTGGSRQMQQQVLQQQTAVDVWLILVRRLLQRQEICGLRPALYCRAAMSISVTRSMLVT